MLKVFYTLNKVKRFGRNRSEYILNSLHIVLSLPIRKYIDNILVTTKVCYIKVLYTNRNSLLYCIFKLCTQIEIRSYIIL